MFVETTLYIKKSLLPVLDDAADIMGISRSRLVSILLLMYMERNRAGNNTFNRLKYQDRDGMSFTTKSLYLRKDVYEKWVDVRKVYKFSASRIIADALKLYLDDILNGRNLPFNYSSMYISKVTYSREALIQILVWGIPEERALEKICKT